MDDERVMGTTCPWVLEFRIGTFFVNDDAPSGGPIELAAWFTDRRSAEEFFACDGRAWVWAAGGLIVPDPRSR